MSFPAALLLLIWGFSTVLGDDSVRQSIIDSIVDVLPLADADDRQQVERLLDDVAAGAGTLGWISAVALLYSASGAIGALRYAVNEAWGERDTRPYVPGKALDAGLTLIVGPVLIIGLGLTLSGALAETLGNPWIAAVLQFTVTTLTPIALLLAVLVGLFRVLAVKAAGFRAPLFGGGVVALSGIVLVQLGAEAYFAALGAANAVYGTLGILLAVVFSAYLDAVAILYGAHVAAQATRLPSAAAFDHELEKRGRVPARHFVVKAVRGLFVRGRRRE